MVPKKNQLFYQFFIDKMHTFSHKGFYINFLYILWGAHMGDIGQERLFHAFKSSMSSYIFASATFICLQKYLSFRSFFERGMVTVFLVKKNR